MTKYQFGKFEVEIDPTDVAFVEKYEAATTEYQTRIATVSQEGRASEIMMRLCGVFYDVFDEIFGKDTSNKMFGKTNSVDLCVKAFKTLVDTMNDYSKTLDFLPNTSINSSSKNTKKK